MILHSGCLPFVKDESSKDESGKDEFWSMFWADYRLCRVSGDKSEALFASKNGPKPEDKNTSPSSIFALQRHAFLTPKRR